MMAASHLISNNGVYSSDLCSRLVRLYELFSILRQSIGSNLDSKSPVNPCEDFGCKTCC